MACIEAVWLLAVSELLACKGHVKIAYSGQYAVDALFHHSTGGVVELLLNTSCTVAVVYSAAVVMNCRRGNPFKKLLSSRPLWHTEAGWSL